MATSRLVAVQDVVQVVRDTLLSPEQMSAFIAKTARDGLANVERIQGRYPKKVFVDGTEGKSEDQVDPAGKIVYLIQPFRRIANEIWREIKLQYMLAFPRPGEKRGSPEYRRHRMITDFELFVNGEKQPSLTVERLPQPGEIWIWVSTMPYSRVAGHRTWSAADQKRREKSRGRRPVAWLDRAARNMNRKFGNFANITHNFSVIQERQIREDKRWNSKTKRIYIKDRRYPSIVMTVEKNVLTSGTIF